MKTPRTQIFGSIKKRCRAVANRRHIFSIKRAGVPLVIWFASLLVGPLYAQNVESDPTIIENNSSVSALTGLGRCLQFDTPAGAMLTLEMKNPNFTGVMKVSRGARCTEAIVARHETRISPGNDAIMSFRSVGGRHLVYVLTDDLTHPAAYSLKLNASPQGSSSVGDGSVAPRSVDMETAAVDPRTALMRRQVASRQAEIVAENERRAERERQAREAEIARLEAAERRREQQAANDAAIWSGFSNAMGIVSGAIQQRAADDAAHRSLELAAAAERAEAARRQAREQRVQQERQEAAANAALSERIALANAQRERMMAESSDPARRTQLAQQTAEGLAAAQRMGTRATVEARTRELAGRGTATRQPTIASGGDGVALPAVRDEAAVRAQAQEVKQQAERRAQQEKADVAAREREVAQAKKAEMDRQRARRLASNASGGLSSVGLGPAQKGATPPGAGTLTETVDHVGPCAATSVTVRYALGATLGDATVSGSFAWAGEAGCTPPPSTKVWLRMQNGAAFGYVAVDPAVPTANGGFGYNATGSPPWNRLICSFNGGATGQCLDEAAARSLWGSGEVVGFEIAW